MLTYEKILAHSRKDWADIIRNDFEESCEKYKPDVLMDGYLKLWDEIRFIKPVQEKALKEINYNLLACIQLKKDDDE